MIRIGWVAFIALALLLLHPVFTMVHVEGFTASIAALGLHMADGSREAFFPSQPFNADFFTLTKLGMVGGVAMLTKGFGIGADSAMRVLMGAGYVPFLASSAILARRWSNASWAMVAVALLLMPGVAESAFFFNDNVPGCGLVLTGLVLFAPRGGSWRLVAAGILIGLGVAVRTDLVLVAVAVPLIAFATLPARAAVRATALVALPALAALFAVYAAIGTTPFAALEAGRMAVVLWDRAPKPMLQIVIVLLFAGLPALILFGLGTAALIRKRRWLVLALALGVPVFVNLVLFGKIWVPRQVLILTPFLAALAATGLTMLCDDWRSGKRLRLSAYTVVVAVVLFGPPVPLVYRDGPHTLIGRVPAIAEWRRWQAGVDRDFATIHTLIAPNPTADTRVILTQGWDEDRYLHLRLWEAGFRPLPSTSACRPLAETLSDGHRTFVHISLHQSFQLTQLALQGARFETLARPCIDAVGTPTVTLLARPVALVQMLAATGGAAAQRLRADPQLADMKSDRLAAIIIPIADVPAVAVAYRAGFESPTDRTIARMNTAMIATSRRIAR